MWEALKGLMRGGGLSRHLVGRDIFGNRYYREIEASGEKETIPE